MSERGAIARRISNLCSGTSARYYTSSKLKTDPLYSGVFTELSSREFPLLDIGCGMGILGLYLRTRGWKPAITGFDYDQRKISEGRKMVKAGGYNEISLSQGDARTELPDHQGDVTILDILQFFDEAEQKILLNQAVLRVAPGGKLIIRSGLKEQNLRFFVTWIGDFFAKFTFWMKAAPVHYPTAESFRSVLEEAGLMVEIRPFWGKTPFNNYLIVGTKE
ncbi:class I SAM-dependent methyltransferase [Verrucomicrobiaceae bacterium 227]